MLFSRKILSICETFADLHLFAFSFDKKLMRLYVQKCVHIWVESKFQSKGKGTEGQIGAIALWKKTFNIELSFSYSFRCFLFITNRVKEEPAKKYAINIDFPLFHNWYQFQTSKEVEKLSPKNYKS